MPKFRVQFRRDTAAGWAQRDPILAPGEPGYEVDTEKFKVGDGYTRWTDLTYTVVAEVEAIAASAAAAAATSSASATSAAASASIASQAAEEATLGLWRVAPDDTDVLVVTPGGQASTDPDDPDVLVITV